MKISRVLLIGTVCLLKAEWGFADGQFLPPSHELFEPLRADPRELHYALRLLIPVAGRLVGEAAIGDYVGIYRWTLPSGTAFQFSGGGGAFGRFNLSGTANDMQSVDFFGNVPFDVRKGRWSGRFMMYHTSSHLGDDYIKTHGVLPEKHSWDNLRWLAAYNAVYHVRFYGGYNYSFRTLPQHVGRNALQAGFEWEGRPIYSGLLQWYWANDFQSWERAGWNPMFNSQFGIRISQHARDYRTVSIFTEFGAGRRAQGQFYPENETHWDLGVKFDFSPDSSN